MEDDNIRLRARTPVIDEDESPSSLGQPGHKPVVDALGVFALATSIICFIIAVCSIDPTLGWSWKLGTDSQIILLGFLLGIMNICMQKLVPTALLVCEAKLGRSTLQNYNAILVKISILQHTSAWVRILNLLLIVLPIALGVAYKQFRGGSTTVAYDLPYNATLRRAYAPTTPALRWGDSYMNACSDFIQRTDPTTVVGDPTNFPIPYGSNMLVLSGTSAATLDLPTSEYLSAVWRALEGNESLTISADVNAFTTQFDPTFDAMRDDDAYWNDIFSWQLSWEARKLTVFWRYIATEAMGFMRVLPPPSTGDAVASCLVGLYNGSDLYVSEPMGYTNDPEDRESINFRRIAMRFNTTRSQCSGKWRISRSDITLLSGQCAQINLDYDAVNRPLQDLWVRHWIAPPPLEYRDAFGWFARHEDTHKESRWRIPNYAALLSTMYSDRAAKQLNGILSAIKADFDDPQQNATAQSSLLYDPTNEVMFSTRSTLHPSVWLYLVLAIQPFINVVAFAVIISSYGVPVSPGFSMISILAGVKRADLSILTGASLSGRTKRPIVVGFSVQRSFDEPSKYTGGLQEREQWDGPLGQPSIQYSLTISQSHRRGSPAGARIRRGMVYG